MILLSAFVSIALMSAGFMTNPASAQSKDWRAPQGADTLRNPLPRDPGSLQKAKKIFDQVCVVCHGAEGKGNGIAGMALNPRPADFSSARVKRQSDGAIFWKITNGRPPMAAYKAVLTDTERWQLVDYIRSLSH